MRKTLLLIALIAQALSTTQLKEIAGLSQKGEFPFPDYFHFDNCPGFNYDDLVENYDFVFKPSPPKAGRNSYLSAQATVKQAMYVKEGKFSISFRGIKLLDYTLPWNQYYEKGDTYSDQILFPGKYAMWGRYTYHIEVLDENGQALFCVNGWFELGK